jgi:hypothetical protein
MLHYGFHFAKERVNEGLSELSFDEGRIVTLKTVTNFIKNKVWISGILLD